MTGSCGADGDTAVPTGVVAVRERVTAEATSGGGAEQCTATAMALTAEALRVVMTAGADGQWWSSGELPVSTARAADTAVYSGGDGAEALMTDNCGYAQ